MSQVILVTGATGKQGGSVVNALLESNGDYTILAVTRNAQSAASKKLATKSPKIKVLQGDVRDVPKLFELAKETTGSPIWGVFSVQAVVGSEEVAQGKALVDESVKRGVKHFVYTSVDRGGDSRSWHNPTTVPHFVTKHEIEHYLRAQAGDAMGWTILRPVAFMENLVMGYGTRVFLAALHDSMGSKKMNWIAASDIGFFAAEAIAAPEEWNHRAIGLAGDELSSDEVIAAFEKAGSSLGYSFSFLGSVLRFVIPEMRRMIDWFASDGYAVNVDQVRKIKPDLKTLEAFVKGQGK